MKPMQLLLVLCAAVSMSLAADPRYREDFHYSYPQSAGGHFSIENFNGSVEVTGWDQNTVDVSGTKYADTEERLHAIRIEVSNSGSSVQVRTVHPDPDHHGNAGPSISSRSRGRRNSSVCAAPTDHCGWRT